LKKARTKLEVDVLSWDLLSRKDNRHRGNWKRKKSHCLLIRTLKTSGFR
jgi:hypothetical protein